MDGRACLTISEARFLHINLFHATLRIHLKFLSLFEFRLYLKNTIFRINYIITRPKVNTISIQHRNLLYPERGQDVRARRDSQEATEPRYRKPINCNQQGRGPQNAIPKTNTPLPSLITPRARRARGEDRPARTGVFPCYMEHAIRQAGVRTQDA